MVGTLGGFCCSPLGVIDDKIDLNELLCDEVTDEDCAKPVSFCIGVGLFGTLPKNNRFFNNFVFLLVYHNNLRQMNQLVLKTQERCMGPQQ